MTRSKYLALAFIAVLAMGAAQTSAAQAGSLHIGQLTILTGHSLEAQQNFLSLPLTAGGNISAICPTSSFEGIAEALALSEGTVTATYGGGTGCKISGLAATVKMNGCKYTITGAGQPAETALVDITGCTAGKQIEAIQNSTGCVITVPEQNGLSHIAFEQTGTDLVAKATLAGITFAENAKCPNPNHHGANATFTANTTVRAFESAEVKQVTLHSHQYTEILCGNQLSLIVT